jgi:hypothetical protein
MDGVCILDLLSFRRSSWIAQLKSRIAAERTQKTSTGFEIVDDINENHYRNHNKDRRNEERIFANFFCHRAMASPYRLTIENDRRYQFKPFVLHTKPKIKTMMDSKEDIIMINGAQLHLIVNHLPIIGFVLFVPVILLACLTKRSDYKRLALLAATVLGLLALPAFWTGEPAEDTLEGQAGVSEDLIEQHEESAELALVAALATSGLAALGWLVSRKKEAWLVPATTGTAVAVILTTGLMAWVGHEGGKIRHPEISNDAPGLSTQDQNVSVRTERDDDD